MLKENGNENGIKINRSNWQKNKLHLPHAFYLSLLLFCTTKTPFCRTKSSNSGFLVKHYFYGGIVVCAYPIFRLLCSCSPLFFTVPHFSLSHRRFEFSCFSSYKIRLFCFQSLALALSLLST